MVRGPTVFDQYWHPDDARRHLAPVNGWWWTGDVGYRDSAGRFFHLDRAVDVIRTRQGPVHCLPLEEVLLTHPALVDVVVIGLPHPVDGEVPVALICPRDSADVDPDECRAWLEARTSIGAAVRRVVVVHLEDIPRGLTGKVLRRVLREQYANYWFESSAPTH